MRKLALVGTLGLAAIALAGCSSTPAATTSAEPETGDIRVWLVGTDTPQDARDYLKETFEEENPGSTLTIEQQEWTGLVDLYTSALSSSDAPDLVEIGNTQAPAFTSVGAFTDLTDLYDELGGDDLLPGFVEVGSYDGKFYAAPYYSGARIVFYNTAKYEEAGIEVPTTLDEYIAAGEALATDDVSGIYFPGQDWYNALPYIWENGGEIAVQADDGTWDAQLSSAESVAGIEEVQEVMENASLAPKDGNEAEAWIPFREGDVATYSAPSWAYWSIVADEDGNPTDVTDTTGVYALPGKDGGAAQVFAGGSNIAIPSASQHQELAKKALAIVESDEYQTILAGAGLVPAKVSLGSEVAAASPEIAAVIAEAAANAKLTPASPKWADVEAAGILQDFFVQVASGGDVASLATALDTEIESILNG